MGVGHDPITCYQGEDVQWEFTVVDPNIASIAGHTIKLVIKASAAIADPPLVGPITCSITSASAPCKFLAVLNVDKTKVIPGAGGGPNGEFRVSARRTDANYSWEYVDAALTVNDSAYIDKP